MINFNDKLCCKCGKHGSIYVNNKCYCKQCYNKRFGANDPVEIVPLETVTDHKKEQTIDDIIREFDKLLRDLKRVNNDK